MKRIVRRYLLAQLLADPPKRRKLALNLGSPMPTLWYQNERGDRFVPDSAHSYIPDGFIYQHYIEPRVLRENVLRTITKEDVDSCTHSDVKNDDGLIEGLEGRICRDCGGSQTKKVGEPWPKEWSSGGSQPWVGSNKGYSANLVLAMTRPTKEEIETARLRGHTIKPIRFDRAVIIAANSCERCMNVLLYRHGLSDGYEEGSEGWRRANTRCLFCQ